VLNLDEKSLTYTGNKQGKELQDDWGKCVEKKRVECPFF
jgi:hypothetical protein